MRHELDRHPYDLTPRRVRTRPLPRLSRRAGFWGVAFATAPSALYGFYAQSEHLSPITLTVVYAVYAVGVAVSLLLAGHVSDVYGRRTVLIPSLFVAAVASIVFLSSTSLAGVIVGRLLTGVALGASVATATAFIADLDAGSDGAPSTRSGIVATVANVGGLAIGPLLAGSLATYFTAAYVGVSLPVLGAGVALEYVRPRVTLLIFAAAVGLGILVAAPLLVARRSATDRVSEMQGAASLNHHRVLEHHVPAAPARGSRTPRPPSQLRRRFRAERERERRGPYQSCG